MNILAICFTAIMITLILTQTYKDLHLDRDPQRRCEQEGLEWFERVNYEGDEPEIVYQNCRKQDKPENV